MSGIPGKPAFIGRTAGTERLICLEWDGYFDDTALSGFGFQVYFAIIEAGAFVDIVEADALPGLGGVETDAIVLYPEMDFLPAYR